MTFGPGQRLGRYQILTALGSGGMGEVYRVRDDVLGRDVALKVLASDVVRDEDRVRRFVQEARAASSLNHPHIVTIHDVGVDEPSGVHYIAMELVEGSTLRTLLRDPSVELKTLIRYLAQVAEGLARAHAAGVVHRDLKPENVMVSRDGYAKVLDFGLAKLTEKRDAQGDRANSPTATNVTSPGVVLGTVGYMSPEQVQGRLADHRSDIFSFGCLLYEAVTRQRAFAANSDIETMHRILRDEPPSIEEVNPQAPAELKRLIRRCLAKDPDQRLQSMRDLAIELSEIARDYDSLPPVSGSRSVGSGVTAAQRSSSTIRLTAIAVIVVALASLALIGFRNWRGGQKTAAPAAFEGMKLTPVLVEKGLGTVALSPDGKYLVRSSEADDGWSLWIRQIATGSDVRLLGPQRQRIGGLRFVPGGDYLDYVAEDPVRPEYQNLFQIPVLGGTPRKLISDVDSRPSFSPDGKRLAFFRYDPIAAETHLIVASADGTGERQLAVRRFPDGFINDAAWSPDGRRMIAEAWQAPGKVQACGLMQFDVETGAETPFGPQDWWGTGYGLAWLPDGSGVVATGVRDETERHQQLWFVPASGPTQRITNDLNDYRALSLAADGKGLVAVQHKWTSALWAVPVAAGSSMRVALRPSAADPFDSPYRLTPDRSILFIAAGRQGRDRRLWSVGSRGEGRVQRTPDELIVLGYALARRSGAIFLEGLKNGDLRHERPHIWKLDRDAASPVQVTSGEGERLLGASPEGGEFLFRKEKEGGVWKSAAAGGEARRLHASNFFKAEYSPDGTRILVGYNRSTQRGTTLVLDIVDRSTGALVKSIPAEWVPSSGLTTARWSPSGRELTYILNDRGVGNLWSRPLDGGQPRRLTHFTTDEIDDFDWSTDGTEIYVSRGETTREVVLITNFLSPANP